MKFLALIAMILLASAAIGQLSPRRKRRLSHLVLMIIIVLLLEIPISITSTSMSMSRGKSCPEQRRA